MYALILWALLHRAPAPAAHHASATTQVCHRVTIGDRSGYHTGYFVCHRVTR